MSRRGPDRTAADLASVTLLPLPGKGLGVFATRPIRCGEVVLAFAGPRRDRARIRDFTHCLEIDAGVFLGPSGGLDDYINHSCAPNCAVSVEPEGALLRAIREIDGGEELTFDYSTAMLTDPTSFACSCGARRCRGVVTAFHGLPRTAQSKSIRRGLVPGFVLGARRAASS